MELSQEYYAVQEQIQALQRRYDTYRQESDKKEADRSGVRRLEELFLPASRRFANDSLHTGFYEEVEQAVSALRTAIDPLAPDEAAQAAQMAVRIILDPKPESERNVSGWMCFAAEILCEPLLVYLTREQLQEHYERYMQVYPKRFQFPNQVKFRKSMEKLLKAKR